MNFFNLYSKRNLVAYCSLLFLFTSCLGPKMINKWVTKKYGEVPAQQKANSLVSIKSNMGSNDGNLSNTVSKTSNFLPLIVYWQMDYKNTCTLNPQIPISNFSKTVLLDKRLLQKLNGQKLELTIDKIPTSFVLIDKARLIFLVYAYGWDKLSIEPEKTEMQVSYRVLGVDNLPVKTGSVTVSNNDKGVKMGMFQSTKKRTLEYLADYDTNVVNMSKVVVEKLITEL